MLLCARPTLSIDGDVCRHFQSFQGIKLRRNAIQRLASDARSRLTSGFKSRSQLEFPQIEKLVLGRCRDNSCYKRLKSRNQPTPRQRLPTCLKTALRARTHWKAKNDDEKRHRERFSIIFWNFVEIRALWTPPSPSSHRNSIDLTEDQSILVFKRPQTVEIEHNFDS